MTLRKYQLADLRWLLQRPCAMYAADIGTGKSLVALELFKRRRKRGEVQRCLIVATPRIIEHTWPDEIAKWCPEYTHATVHGPKWRQALDTDADFYLTTYDTFKKIAGELYDDINMVVFDESHKLKGHSSQRFKQVKPFLRSFEFRLAMTGSPMPNSLEDLWSQSYVLDHGASLGAFITHFRRRYFTPHPAGFGWVPNENAQAEVFSELRGLVRRREATPEAGLPEVLHNDIMVSLPPKVYAQYKQMEDDFLLALDSGTVAAANAGGASSKCRQIANGFVYEGRKRVPHAVHTKKLEALDELVESLQGQPLLVAYSFAEDLRHMQLRKIPTLTGLGRTKARALLASWNRGDVPVLAIHPASAGEGLNLQAGGHHIAWYGLPWDAGMYKQTNGRLARSGQTHTVVVHHILARHTIERRVAAALSAKKSSEESLFRALSGGRA